MGLRLQRSILTILWAIAPGVLLALAFPTPASAAHLDKKLKEFLKAPPAMVEIVVTTRGVPSERDAAFIRSLGGEAGQPFEMMSAFPARVPSQALETLRKSSRFKSVSVNAQVGALWDTNFVPLSAGVPEARALHGVTGAGIGVAVIDSGAYYHDDLWDSIVEWAEFTEDRKLNPVIITRSFSYDYYGHGTHVAGILAGTGKTQPAFTGTAPGADLIVLKVLGSDGTGPLSRLLRALDWVGQNAARYNIRVVNLSVGHPVYESYTSDPLCIAIEALVRRGIVVVAAAGNYGRLSDGTQVYGGIVSPAHSPYVITVGAMNPRGTPERGDDVMATFSSRGPTLFDGLVKPDLVAPGVFAASLLAPSSTLHDNFPQLTIDSRLYDSHRGADDYYVLSGTSMAAPVVSGIVALMLEMNPSLTPNLVKAILQHTAEDRGYDLMTQGAGYANAPGALEAAAKITQAPGLVAPGGFWLSGPLSGESSIAGQGVTWNGLVLWNYSVLWGGSISYQFNSLWGLGVIWGGVAALDASAPAMDEVGVTSQGVTWSGTISPLGVIWNGIQMQEILFGESTPNPLVP